MTMRLTNPYTVAFSKNEPTGCRISDDASDHIAVSGFSSPKSIPNLSYIFFRSGSCKISYASLSSVNCSYGSFYADDVYGLLLCLSG